MRPYRVQKKALTEMRLLTDSQCRDGRLLIPCGGMQTWCNLLVPYEQISVNHTVVCAATLPVCTIPSHRGCTRCRTRPSAHAFFKGGGATHRASRFLCCGRCARGREGKRKGESEMISQIVPQFLRLCHRRRAAHERAADLRGARSPNCA